MYYVNRKTSRKSWMRPEEQQLDLELNMSIGHNEGSSSPSSTSNMVALACSNCHLLVILCRSSPSCPNCKYVHSLAQSSPKAKAHAPIGPSNWGIWRPLVYGNIGVISEFYVHCVRLSFLVFWYYGVFYFGVLIN